MFIYTDGACKGNPGPGGWGVVVYSDDTCSEEIHVMNGRKEHSTNNQMEMIALIEALKYVKEHHSNEKVIIYSDSNIVVKGVNEWLTGWKRRGWKKSDGKPVLNKDLWMTIDQLLPITVEIRKVKGHSGDVGNDRADELANVDI